MSTVTVVATVEASNVPPRVRLDVTDTGTPNLFATTVTRLNPDGSTSPVRTPDGNPLTLVTSGTDRVGTVYDYEADYGAPVSYSTAESPTVVSSPVTVDATSVWLVPPGVPSLAMPVELQMGSADEEVWDVRQGVFWPMGREFPVVQTDGIRKAPSSSITVAVDTLEQLAALRAVLRSATVLLLNVPASLGLGIDTNYIAVGPVRNRRISSVGTDTHRAVELPYQVVDRPVGGTQAARTLADLMVYPTLAASMPRTHSRRLAGRPVTPRR
jgi:hypothetical protein